MNGKIQPLILSLQQAWHCRMRVQNDEIWMASAPFAEICVVYRSPSSRQIRQILAIPNTVLLFAHDGKIDAYARSFLDETPVVAHDIDAKDEAFWRLGAHSDCVAFAFELERRFGCRRLERRFILRFRTSCKALASAWENVPNERARSDVALLTLLRLVFVAFLASRGMLDGRRHFLIEETRRAHLKNQNIYREMIAPLFFETLNRAPQTRSPRAMAFGNVPYLNGGLFMRSETESQCPDISSPNRIWLDIMENLFEPFSFAPNSDDNLKNFIDPWMIGHLFESLMDSKLRERTASYYTPMPLASHIAREAVVSWIAGNLPVANVALWLQNDPVPWEKFSRHELRLLDKALQNIRILDPASGSGAFLQSAFRILFDWRVNVLSRLGRPFSSSAVARQILAYNLFGVDLLPLATQLCELRLWLELVRIQSCDEPIRPLPNLDLNILCGDAILNLDTFLHCQNPNHRCPNVMPAEFSSLKAEYALSNGEKKIDIRQRLEGFILQAGRALFSKIFNACEDHSHQSVQLTMPFHQKDKGFSEKQKNMKKKCLECDFQIDPKRFTYSLQWAEVMADGGFDVVIGNPPWFSLHTLPKNIRELMKCLYATAKTPLQSADVSALFVENALRCVRKNGRIAMLLPNKLFYAPSYQTFRKHLQENAKILQLKDWSRSKANTFDATAYPASLLIAPESQQKCDPLKELLILKPPPVPVPSVKNYAIVKRGFYTGRNEIFIGTVAEHPRENSLCLFSNKKFADVCIEKFLIHPIVRGADIRAYHYAAPLSVIFTHQWQNPIEPLRSLPVHAGDWFLRQNILRPGRLPKSRAPHAICGCCAHLREMKVVWRDIAVELEACFIPDANVLPINTAYYIPVKTQDEGYLLAAYLNSRFARRWCRQKAEHAKNGYRRYFAWVIQTLPWRFDRCPETCRQLIELSKICHDAQKPADLSAEFATINAIIDKLYAVNAA